MKSFFKSKVWMCVIVILFMVGAAKSTLSAEQNQNGGQAGNNADIGFYEEETSSTSTTTTTSSSTIQKKPSVPQSNKKGILPQTGESKSDIHIWIGFIVLLIGMSLIGFKNQCRREGKEI